MKRLLIVLLFLFLTFSSQAHHTTLVMVGGGDIPIEAMETMFIESKGKPIWILPWATSNPAAAYDRISALLIEAGAKNVLAKINPKMSKQELAEFKKNLKKAGGIFFPGGDQNILMKNIRKLDLAPLLQSLFHEGVVFGGTSAGTAIMSESMITGKNPPHDLAKGLGLLKGYLVDQHFIARNREARLLNQMVKIGDSHLIGVGIDEGMSVVVRNNTHFEAYGPSKVIIYQNPPYRAPSTEGYLKKELENFDEYNIPHRAPMDDCDSLLAHDPLPIDHPPVATPPVNF